MFIQGFMWIVGFAIIFPAIYFTVGVIFNKLFPLTAEDELYKTLRQKINNLKAKKLLLKIRKEETVLMKDSLKAGAEIEKIDKEIQKLTKKLGETK